MKKLKAIKLKKVASYKYPDTPKGHAEFNINLHAAEDAGYIIEYRINGGPVNDSWINLFLGNWESVWTLDIFEKE